MDSVENYNIFISIALSQVCRSYLFETSYKLSFLKADKVNKVLKGGVMLLPSLSQSVKRNGFRPWYSLVFICAETLESSDHLANLWGRVLGSFYR
jgi:hypothetical protein